MRTISDDDAVRLYHLDPESGAATTLLYGTLDEALETAATCSEDMQSGLYLQTSNDVEAYTDLSMG